MKRSTIDTIIEKLKFFKLQEQEECRSRRILSLFKDLSEFNIMACPFYFVLTIFLFNRHS